MERYLFKIIQLIRFSPRIQVFWFQIPSIAQHASFPTTQRREVLGRSCLHSLPLLPRPPVAFQPALSGPPHPTPWAILIPATTLHTPQHTSSYPTFSSTQADYSLLESLTFLGLHKTQAPGWPPTSATTPAGSPVLAPHGLSCLHTAGPQSSAWPTLLHPQTLSHSLVWSALGNDSQILISSSDSPLDFSLLVFPKDLLWT